MQVAGEQLAAKHGDPLSQIQRANEIAKFGLAQARRSLMPLLLQCGKILTTGIILSLRQRSDRRQYIFGIAKT